MWGEKNITIVKLKKSLWTQNQIAPGLEEEEYVSAQPLFC